MITMSQALTGQGGRRYPQTGLGMGPITPFRSIGSSSTPVVAPVRRDLETLGSITSMSIGIDATIGGRGSW